ncbi:putative three finger toxin protein, partial [Naja naja]
KESGMLHVWQISCTMKTCLKEEKFCYLKVYPG